MGCNTVVAVLELPQNRIIKQSLCDRAKYKLLAIASIHPMAVVPHPKNRGGDAVKFIRTKELAGSLVEEGYDMQQAN